MIHLTKDTTQFIYLSLTEAETLTTPNYLFRFVNRETRAEVTFVLLNAADVSLFKDRYNKFSIDVNKYFGWADAGEWLYYIYEQASAYNKEYAEATGLLEEGIMRLNDSESFSYVQHSVDNTYITR